MKKNLLVGLVVAAFVGTAAADGFVSVGAGSSTLRVDCDGAPTCDKSGSALTLSGGYLFDGGWGIEGAVMNFGTAQVAEPGASLKIKNSAVGVGVVGFLPVNNWVFSGRLGVAQVSTKVSATFSGVSGGDTDKNVTTYVGLGVGYHVSKAVSIDFATLVTQAKYNKDGLDLGNGNVRAFTLGVTTRF